MFLLSSSLLFYLLNILTYLFCFPEEYYEFEDNHQYHNSLPSSLTIEIIPPIKQESVIISTEVARSMLQENAEVEERYVEKLEAEPTAGVHFLTDEENLTNKSDESYEKKKSELLEYLIRQDGSVVCKLCGEVLASRTHWYRHKYKLHVNNLGNPAPLFKCFHCNVFFKSRKGYMGHIATRHGDNQDVADEVNVVVKEEIVETSYNIVSPPSSTTSTNNSKKKVEKVADWEEQRVKEAKLVADIIDRVRKECEAQGAPVGRRGYSRRSTSIMNTVA